MASDPFVGEIMIFAGSFAPAGWYTCQGQLINIADNDTLFNLIGTTYGGDGVNTFAMPDLQGRVPIHMGSDSLGNSYAIGQSGGVEAVTLTTNQIPPHTHSIIADTNAGTLGNPQNAVYASSAPLKLYSGSGAPLARTMSPSMLQSQGGSQPHTNLQPSLAVLYCISAFGIYPTQ